MRPRAERESQEALNLSADEEAMASNGKQPL